MNQISELLLTARVDREAERQTVLDSYGILDTLDEQAYDDITRLASYICRTPIAAINFIDHDRQWSKSRIGFTGREAPREFVFCSHAINHPGQVMIVPDAFKDPRFAASPLVTGDPHIRFYAGAPLVAPGGAALGTICVADCEARQIDPAQIESLESLSRQVVSQLELRRMNDALSQANTKLKLQNLTDALTCVPNRRAFNQKLPEEIARAARSSTPLALMMLDIDNFKSYNDHFGHLAGDEALHGVAQILQANARPYDFLARYGGEEFVIILPAIGQDGAVPVAERLRDMVATRAFAHRQITLSIGVAALPPEGDGKSLIEAADRNLYKAKTAGRNCVCG